MTHAITQSISDVFSRPADNNYDSMSELIEVAGKEMDESRTIKTTSRSMTFSTDDERYFVNLEGHTPLPLTNFSMTQVAGMAKIYVNTLERLHERERSDLVVENLDALFWNDDADDKFILVRDHFNGDSIDSVARAVNGGAYSRLWDHEVFTEMEEFLIPRGFTPILPALRSNAMRSGLMHGLNTGLFRGDQCSFGFFFLDKDLPVDTSDLGGLKPGMMVWNSEVGARSFGYHTFYYHEMSGNIMVWTPANHRRKRFVHRGDISKAFKEYVTTLEDVADNCEPRLIKDWDVFKFASTTPYAVDHTAAVARLQRELKMSAANANAAVLASQLEQNSYGDPLSVWNIALGIAWEAGQCSRAESLVDGTLVATKMMRSALKV